MTRFIYNDIVQSLYDLPISRQRKKLYYFENFTKK